MELPETVSVERPEVLSSDDGGVGYEYPMESPLTVEQMQTLPLGLYPSTPDFDGVEGVLEIDLVEETDTSVPLDAPDHGLLPECEVLSPPMMGPYPRNNCHLLPVDLTEFGLLPLRLHGRKFCKQSSYTGWHIKRNTGVLAIGIGVSVLNFMSATPLMYVRLMLVRSDPSYRNVPVAGVCNLHQADVSPGTERHVLRVARRGDQTRYYYVDGIDTRPNLCFPLIGENILNPIIYLSFACGSKCVTNTLPVVTERSHGLLLCLTLETYAPNLILARRVIQVWPKESVNQADLALGMRHDLRGSVILPMEDWTIQRLRENIIRTDLTVVVKEAMAYGLSLHELLRCTRDVWEEEGAGFP